MEGAVGEVVGRPVPESFLGVGVPHCRPPLPTHLTSLPTSPSLLAPHRTAPSSPHCPDSLHLAPTRLAALPHCRRPSFHLAPPRST